MLEVEWGIIQRLTNEAQCHSLVGLVALGVA
jgi:hypothetical protein